MKKPYILVVDDNHDMLRIIKRTLELEGFEAGVASDGNTAIALVKEREPDLVLLDIIMPDMDGYQVLDIIRQHSNVPVIMLTGVRESNSIERSLGLGADDYIKKPFRSQELLARIRAKLRRAEQQGP